MEFSQIDLVLVEDNKIDADVILRLVKKENPAWKCLVIDNGEEAIQFFLRTGIYSLKTYNMPRLILMDIHLPSFSGIEILEKIRQVSSNKYIPIVMLSSSNRVNDIHQSYYFGANAYVVKPSKLEQMKRVVQAMTSFWLDINTAL